MTGSSFFKKCAQRVALFVIKAILKVVVSIMKEIILRL